MRGPLGRTQEESLHPMIEERLRRATPVSCVVAGSTPVPSFGDAEQASVATVGINPSKVEFLDHAGDLMRGDASRFICLPDLECDSLASASLDQVERVYEGCRSYFHRHPYRRWFDRLEQLLAVLDASYYDGSAAHLDLAHWSTNPVWGALAASERNALVNDGRDFLGWQLSRPHLRLVLLNGRTVFHCFKRVTGIELEVAKTLEGPMKRTAKIYVGELRTGTRVLGWSTNLQSSYGVTDQFRRLLAGELRALHPAAHAA
jgi:hypothetical protein